MIWLLAIANWAPDQGLGNSFASATHSTNVPCAGAYGQCGGDKWNGAKCCPGTVCHHESIYYSQCLSDGTGEQHTGASQAASTHTTPTTSWQSAPAGKAHGSNAFASHKFYVGEAYQNRVRTAMEARWAEGQTRSAMGQMLNTPSAYWVDRIARIGRSGDPTEDDTLENLLVDAARRSPPQLVVVILYNLPNRDCHAYASNGEICCEHKPDGSCEYLSSDPTCRQGLETYKSRYVDAFAAALERHASVPVVVVIEPDSLPNLATNLDEPRCGNPATRAAYSNGVAYAINTLASRAPHASLYLDAGHGGWLGWPQQADKFANVVSDLANNAHLHLRGFATNVANYQTLGTACPTSAFDNLEGQSLAMYCDRSGLGRHAGCCKDPCRLLDQFNSANNELNFVQLLNARVTRILPRWAPRFIIDTGRNGVDHVLRQSCANWCNIRGAGLGRTPTATTDLPSLIDAYFWLKTPGESDGCTERLPDGSYCPRFDRSCASIDSIGSMPGEPRAPEAGDWFLPQLAELSCKGGSGSDACGEKLAAAAIEDGQTLDFNDPPPPPHVAGYGEPSWSRDHQQPTWSRDHSNDRGQASWSRDHTSSDHDFLIVGGLPPPPPSPEASGGPPLALYLILLTVIGGVAYLTRQRWQPILKEKLGEERYEALAALAMSTAAHTAAFVALVAVFAYEVGGSLLSVLRVRLGLALVALGRYAAGDQAVGAMPAVPTPDSAEDPPDPPDPRPPPPPSRSRPARKGYTRTDTTGNDEQEEQEEGGEDEAGEEVGEEEEVRASREEEDVEAVSFRPKGQGVATRPPPLQRPQAAAPASEGAGRGGGLRFGGGRAGASRGNARGGRGEAPGVRRTWAQE